MPAIELFVQIVHVSRSFKSFVRSFVRSFDASLVRHRESWVALLFIPR